MLKIAILDSGYGGEFFADRLESELPIVKTIRIIDWRHAEQYLTNYKTARELATEALRPYIGKVDLIILANHLLSLTSLKYFRRKYPQQSFLGLELKAPDTFVKRDIIMITTKAVTKTMGYHGFIFGLHRSIKTIALDSWPAKIDDGELSHAEIAEVLTKFLNSKKLHPQEVILGCSQFEDIKPNLKQFFGKRIRIYSSFDDTIREACKMLHIRGGVNKRK